MEIVCGDLYIREIKQLIQLYLLELDRNLSFQNIEQELQDLHHKYCFPHGRLLAAIENSKVVGCVAYTKLNEHQCEMKRLYVLPSCRHQNIGQSLIKTIIQTAGNDGYQEMLLDTISPLKQAISLYHMFGFKECDPYYNNPMDDVIYMKKELSRR
ncbi:GNAT family N-acetyltransferase [[Clostridium] spiroforme]|nr:GNAT family N-acetyltransferase [Thomasclavelia spiroformis]MBM6881012.1 GNAT family N-acetyltransferase [Thomasclavelia spiroformis]